MTIRCREGMRLAALFLSGYTDSTHKLTAAADAISEYLAQCPPEVRPDGTVVGVFDTIIANEENIMSALTDLQAADASLQAEVATFLTDIATALQNAATANDPAIEQVVTDINNEVAALQQGDPENQASSATPPASTSPAAPAS
jgi:hypothetical protein